MFSHVATAATSFWNGPSGLSGTSQTVQDAFEVPGNATVIDAWLHVDESGFLEDGYGETWSGQDVQEILQQECFLIQWLVNSMEQCH